MTKYLGALVAVLCLSLFGAGAANAFVTPTEATFRVDGDGDKDGKKKHKKHKKHHKKHHHRKHHKKNNNNNS
jgi:hypothetical protein